MQKEGRRPSSTKPAQIKWATSLLWVSLAIGILKANMDWVYLKSQGHVSFMVYVLAMTFASTALLVWMIGLGKNWARIVFLVFFLVGVVPYAFIVHAQFGRSPASGTMGLSQFALQGLALYMLFTNPGKEWFRSVPG